MQIYSAGKFGETSDWICLMLIVANFFSLIFLISIAKTFFGTLSAVFDVGFLRGSSVILLQR